MGNLRHGSKDRDLFQTVRNGIPGTQMPAFSDLPTDNVWRIISYLRSLGGNGGPANEVVTGDVAAGEKIFWGRGGCGRCHEVNGRGGIVAPDLSAAGTNSADHLRQMILNPNAAITARHWFEQSSVSVKTRDGEEIRGVKRSEDNYTLILTDEAGELRRFDKQNLVEQHPEFLMPDNYGQVLSGYEIQSLVAYLKSLKARDLSKTAQADLSGGLSFERLRHAPAEPQNWLTYWGGYQGLHFSPLNQITPSNLGQLQARWARHSLPGWERAQERTRAREYPRATAPRRAIAICGAFLISVPTPQPSRKEPFSRSSMADWCRAWDTIKPSGPLPIGCVA